MSTQHEVDSLIRQISELPADAQTEVIDAVLGLRAEYLGIYDDENHSSSHEPAQHL